MMSFMPPMSWSISNQDRDAWPTPEMPLRQSSAGEKHLDFVPVCFVNGDV